MSKSLWTCWLTSPPPPIVVGSPPGDGVKTALMVDPRTKALVLNGKPGHLQFYSLQRDQQLYNVSTPSGRQTHPRSAMDASVCTEWPLHVKPQRGP